jgi:uncharacterized protein YjbI with pentapeptide repeats
MGIAMVRPHRAVVAPRVLSDVSGDPVLLEDVLRPYIGQAGAIAILGPVGSGRTTALAHLAAAFPGRIALFDDEVTQTPIRDAAAAGLAAYAAGRIHRMPHLATLCLAPWRRDEGLEYLMATRGDACAAVMRRLATDTEIAMLGGLAELWCAVLDRMAAGAADVATALADVATGAAPGDRVLRHRVVRILRRAHDIALDVRGGPGPWAHLALRQEVEVIREAARLLADAPEARDALAALCDAPRDDRQPMAASLLVALDPERKPRGVPLLSGAHLRGARWRAVELRGVDLRDADLAGADLDAAMLDDANAIRASFRGARLRGASLRRARLLRADLRSADLAGAHLALATLQVADLREARLMGADLAEANLFLARVEGADLSGANLSGARCPGLDLRRARIDGATFSAAALDGCHLDGADVRGARFDHADLQGASLTASVMPKACFRDANLSGVQAADISWEGADLRGADLSRAIFHMGSSRSGLVGSLLASEGTRTGFYTDDYEERHFKAPEAIRKANLRASDLRGANVESTDFYLVDLRGALYDGTQERHFRRSGAILENKAT